MKATRNNSLISAAKVGVGFEHGKDKDPKTYRDTVRGIERLLGHYGMLKTASLKKTKVEFFEAFDTLRKPHGFIIRKGITNFKRVPKGAVVGYHAKTKKEIRTKTAFYPILMLTTKT